MLTKHYIIHPLIADHKSKTDFHAIYQSFYQIVLVSEKHRDDKRHDQPHHASAHKIKLPTFPNRSDRKSLILLFLKKIVFIWQTKQPR